MHSLTPPESAKVKPKSLGDVVVAGSLDEFGVFEAEFVTSSLNKVSDYEPGELFVWHSVLRSLRHEDKWVRYSCRVHDHIPVVGTTLPLDQAGW
jgi:hypothetical protein